MKVSSRLTFDTNDTIRASGGVPPYTYAAILNSFEIAGNTYSYKASRPGLDTITVTDALGNTASALVTVSLMDFGGMYGYSKVGNYNNPITGALNCPAGYTPRPIMGTTNVDYPLFYCYRIHADGIAADYDFGGIYSQSGTGVRLNPLTRAASCPTGYAAHQVFGESSRNPDYPAYFCYKKHDETVPEAAAFAGMYAPAFRGSYHNPITGGQRCPSSTSSTLMLGTANVDYPFYFCTYPISTIKLTPEYTNLALNDTMSFDQYDSVRVSGGTPPYAYAASLGTITQSGSTYTYKAAKPGLDTLTVTDSKGNIAAARITVAYMDFGGMYGYGTSGNFNNPITGTLGCPAGYKAQQTLGAPGVDSPLYYCYRIHKKGEPAGYDFGGIYSGSSEGPRKNPITDASTCPPGYTLNQVLGQSTNTPDYPVYMCYKPHLESIPEAAHFAGMYGHGFSEYFKNPATDAFSCPAYWNQAKMLGTANVDYPFYFCY